MLKFPPADPQWFVGIDPGFLGAICIMDVGGLSLRFWDMPFTGTGKKREFNLGKLEAIFRTLKELPQCLVGLEWPTTRPGEGAERCERFGRGKGYLEAMAYCHGLSYQKVPPNLWKGRLGLPGKQVYNANSLAFDLFEKFYQQYRTEVRGPRDGFLDGRCDAALIAHFLRIRSSGGMRAVVEQFGKESDQALLLLMTGGRKRKKPELFT